MGATLSLFSSLGLKSLVSDLFTFMAQALTTLKEEFEESAGVSASLEQWANAAAMSVNALGRQIAAGEEARQRLVEVGFEFLITFRIGAWFWPDWLGVLGCLAPAS